MFSLTVSDAMRAKAAELGVTGVGGSVIFDLDRLSVEMLSVHYILVGELTSTVGVSNPLSIVGERLGKIIEFFRIIKDVDEDTRVEGGPEENGARFLRFGSLIFLMFFYGGNSLEELEITGAGLQAGIDYMHAQPKPTRYPEVEEIGRIIAQSKPEP